MNLEKRHIKLLKKNKIQISKEFKEYINSGLSDLSDYCHQCAESDQNVIYIYKAKALFNEANYDEQEKARSMVEETGGLEDNPDMDKISIQLAYWVVYHRVKTALEDEIIELKEQIGSLIDDLYEIDNELIYG